MGIKEKAKEIFDIAAEPTVDIVSSMFLEGVVGSVVPGAVSAVLAYKQKRQERNYEKFMEITNERCQELEDKLEKLSEASRRKFITEYFGIVSDYVLDEKQEEKIKYIVNGFINLASIENSKEDFVLTYYDALKELRMVDIAVLRTYKDIDLQLNDVMRDFDLDEDQLTAVKNKLVRQNLLYYVDGSAIMDGTMLIKKRTHSRYGLSGYGDAFLKFFTTRYI